MIRRTIGLLGVVVLTPFLLAGCFLDSGAFDCDGPCFEDPEASNENSYVCACTCEPTIRKIEVRVAASTDDAERLADGSSRVDNPDLGVGTLRLVGVRFTDIPIPTGADIVSAWIDLTPANDDTTPLGIEIFGEDSDDAATFSTVLDDLLSRPTTASSVVWTPAPWHLGDPPQQSPDLEPILQEIIDRPGWVENNALALILSTPAGDGLRRAHAFDGYPLNAPRLVVTFADSSAPGVGPQEIPVCMPDYANPNLDGSTPSDVQLEGDCKGRVEPTFEGLAQACGYPSQCTCSMQPDSRRFSDRCDEPCVEDPVDGDCSDFDPVGGILTATNAPGDEPICITNSPLASGVFGRRSECRVNGMAHVDVDGEEVEARANGVLHFRGGPCPEQSCAVGMEYRLDLAPVTFRDAFGGAVFTELAGLGESPADSAIIGADGQGRFASGALLSSARGERNGVAGAMVTRNTAAIDVEILFGAVGPRCALNGALIGGVDPETMRCTDGRNACASDRDCTDGDTCDDVRSSPIMLGLDLAGAMVNQPPTADAGPEQRVECPDRVVLDGSASSDLDDNLALFTWRQGGRSGPEVGFDEMVQLEQGLGRQTYVLRVIDDFAQTDEDSTMVTVVDTRPPLLSCSVATPVIGQTNRSMVDVGLMTTARDSCEGPLPAAVRVFADESGGSPSGRPDPSPDAIRVGRGALRLRAERNGDGDGRVYLVVVEATDSSDNLGIACCTAVVPYSKSASALRAVQDQAAAAQAFCVDNGGAAPGGYVPLGMRPSAGRMQ